MKISKRSWHYRLIQWPELGHPKSICGYFWLVVFMVTIGWWFLGSCFLIAKGIIWIHEKFGGRIRNPGIFTLWYRARKEKVCPLIEYTND